jgi:hypothetical protein
MRSGKAIVKSSSGANITRLLSPIERAAKIQIRNDADYLIVGEWMKRADQVLASPAVVALAKQAELTAAAHKHAVSMRNAVFHTLRACKKIFGEKRVAYRTRKEAAAAAKRERDEEKLRLKQIAEAKQIAGKMASNGDKRGAQMVLKAAMNAPAPSLPASSAVPEEEGFVETTAYGFEIEKPEIVPAKYWVIDESLVRKDVNTFGMNADIPGVRIWEVPKEHTRKGK